MCIGKDISGKDSNLFPSDCTGFPPFSTKLPKTPKDISDTWPKIFWCPWCSSVPENWQDYQAWRYEHDQKEHPTYWCSQIGLIPYD